ncbi:MAG: pilus assembly protein PilM [Nitrospiraceae bacterium]|nr:pilus assembly protein PilM [Nitrospiraceae bacterium]
MFKDKLFKTILGIDLRDDSLAVTCLKNTISGIKLSSAMTLPFNSDGHEDAVLEMKKFISQHRINTKNLFVSVPKRWAITKFMDISSPGRDSLEGLIKYEIERHIPFQIEDVFYDFHVLGKSGNSYRIVLVAVQKEKVERIIEFLGKIPLQPQAINVSFSVDAESVEMQELSSSLGACLSGFKPGGIKINILPHKQEAREKQIGPLITKISLPVILLLGLSISVSEVFNEKRSLRAIEERIKKNEPEMAVVEKLSAELNELDKQRRFLLSVKADNVSKLDMLAEMTDIIPADAWITELDYNEPEKKNEKYTGELVISGFAASSSRLISLLEGSMFFENVEFVGPITKSGGKEIFKIKAMVVKPAKRKPDKEDLYNQ